MAMLTGGLLLLVPAVFAQHGRGSVAGPPVAPGAAFGGADMGRGLGAPQPGNARDADGSVNPMHSGLQIGPPGRWWDDKQFAKELRLRPDQRRRMDGIFNANRATLLKRLRDLEQEQSRMEAMVRTRPLEETTLFSQIDRVSQARAELEKANTHYLLQLRAEMDPDQISRLEQHP